jgi:hypothetical protein
LIETLGNYIKFSRLPNTGSPVWMVSAAYLNNITPNVGLFIGLEMGYASVSRPMTVVTTS